MIDAHPALVAVSPGAPMGGYQQLIRGEPFRGKFRKSFEKPVPVVPNQPDRNPPEIHRDPQGPPGGFSEGFGARAFRDADGSRIQLRVE